MELLQQNEIAGHSLLICWLSSRNFFRGAKSIPMQTSFVMLSSLLYLDQTSGGGGAKAPFPLWKKARSVTNICINTTKLSREYIICLDDCYHGNQAASINYGCRLTSDFCKVPL